jgi:hypothetical protein
MSVKVNLLPREVAGARAARRTTRLTVACVLLFAVALGGAYLQKLGEIDQAELARDTVQADVVRLQTELATLEEYRQLADQLDARNAVLTAAMANEISFARVLNDMSLSFPASSSLRTLQVATRASAQAVEPAAGDVSFGEPVASVTYAGYSVERFAPGVETVIVEFDKVSAFFSSFIVSARLEEIGTTEVTGFDGTVQLDDGALTGRYADGLPQEVAP